MATKAEIAKAKAARANRSRSAQVAQATAGVPGGSYPEAQGLQRTAQHAVQPQPGYPMAQVPGGGYGVALVPFQAPADARAVFTRTTADILGDARKIVDARDPAAIRPNYGTSEWGAFWRGISGFEDEILNAAGEGSEFTRIRNGWRVKFMDGGATLLSSGPTIIEAILSHGEQIDHTATAQVARTADQARLAAIGQPPSVPPVVPANETRAQKRARVAAEQKAAKALAA